MKKICFSLILFTIFMLISFSYKTSIDVETTLFDIANQTLESFNLKQNQTYNVTLKNGIYLVDINGDIQNPQYIPNHKYNSSMDNISKTNKKLDRIVKISKNKVIEYVKSSSILVDKNMILQELEKIEIKAADFSYPAKYENRVIYVSRNFGNEICEWMIVREYIHALAEITNKGIDNKPYTNTEFNEALTDIIAYSINQSSTTNFESDYACYYESILLYIGCFDNTAITAYFYGYEEIYKIIDKDELDFFILSFGQILTNELARVCVSSSINKWALI